MITERAYAKVNLSLDIVGKREDGYHLVRMVMQSLDIADILTLEKFTAVPAGSEKGIVDYSSSDRIITYLTDKRAVESGGIGELPMGDDNLIYRAARVVLERYVWKEHPEQGVKITLEKHIPIAAGMAGGSSDAAATLRGINQLFELGIMDAELMELGVTLGADVPYCIMGGTALSEGIGERLTRLPDIPAAAFVVVKPRISISTAEAYGGYDRMFLESSRLHSRIAPDVDAQVDAIYAGSLQAIAGTMKNVLEPVAADKYTEIGLLERRLIERGALNAKMSGSGPTVFAIFEDESMAEEAAKSLEMMDEYEQVFVVRPVK